MLDEQKYCVTVLDTSGIQEYVFGSNELQHIISASALVHYATHEWVYEVLNDDHTKTNISRDGIFCEAEFIQDGLDSELIYSGGGNTVILFKSLEKAKAFTRKLSRRILQQSPGIDLVVAHSPEYDWQDAKNPLRSVVQATIALVNARKDAHSRSTPLLGLGVTADCQFTGLPAVGKNKDSRRVSAEIKAKLDFYAQAEQRLDAAVPSEYRNEKNFANDFNQIGEKKKSSYLAVIHIDGNGMGQRVKDVSALPQCADPRVYITTIRTFSHSIDLAAREALRAVTLEVTKTDKTGKIGGVIPVSDRMVPFRPIVFGGDDVTFVCDGRLGLVLTQFYLSNLNTYPLNIDPASSQGSLLPISGRAGIAIVKTHYPFSQAYKLATALEKSAKGYIQEQGGSMMAMDWHFAGSGPIAGMEEIRKREYGVPAGNLCMRPIHLDDGKGWRSWENFAKFTRNFQDESKKQKNKIMGLREAARSGGPAVQNYLQVGSCPNLLLPVPGFADSEKSGWVDGRCTFFDMIEAMDFFVDFKQGER